MLLSGLLYHLIESEWTVLPGVPGLPRVPSLGVAMLLKLRWPRPLLVTPGLCVAVSATAQRR